MNVHFEGSPEVLISGAGPSGLALGLALARHGIRAEILDRTFAPQTGLRAVALQAGTLELMQRFLGRDVVDRIVSQGRKLTRIVAHHGRREVILELANLPSSFPFLLTIDQARFEQLMCDELGRVGVTVRRGLTLVSFTPAQASVACEITGLNNVRIRSGARYLVGCDGAHSFVRSKLGFSFPGHADSREYYVGDLDLSGESLSKDAHHLFFSRAGLAAVFPLPGSHLDRALLLPAPNPKSSGPQNFIDLAAALLPASVKVGTSYSVGHLRFHDRISPRLRNGNVFLAGDAAHVCNPAGGQGMNLAIHDALSLSRLLQVALRRGSEAALGTYEAERLEAAKAVRSLTRMLTSSAARSDSFFFRNVLWPAMNGHRAQNYLISRIAQLPQAKRILECTWTVQTVR